MLLKRGGIGLLSNGVDDATAGSCAVACPACPRPDISPRDPNVREEGMSMSTDKDLSYVIRLIDLHYINVILLSLIRWLDSLIVMLDCNFRLKSKDRSITTDPALGSGLAYYVEEESYQAYLRECPEQTEVKLLLHLRLISL